MTAEERIQILRDAIRITPEFCLERARLYTAAHKDTVYLAAPLRRAKIMEKIMTERSAIIFDEELIPRSHGSGTSRRPSAPPATPPTVKAPSKAPSWKNSMRS